MDQDHIKTIESRTQQDVINLLKRYGLGKIRRRKWLDYMKAKRICFEELWIDSEIYDKQIGWIGDYLGI